MFSCLRLIIFFSDWQEFGALAFFFLFYFFSVKWIFILISVKMAEASPNS